MRGWSGPVLVHEVGHIHGLSHCTGYRRSFDALGNYVTSGSIPYTGFYTAMQYSWGGALDNGGSPCGDDGENGVPSLPTLSFADSNLMWFNSSRSRWEITGATGH